MKQILNTMPLDIVPHPEGFIIVEPEQQKENGKIIIRFWLYNLRTMRVRKIKKELYLACKFGPAYNEITKQLSDYLSCAVCETPENSFNIVYPTGEIGIFDIEGTLKWTGDLLYHNCSIRSCAPDGNNLWCAVPDQNAIIKYATDAERIDFRIGGDNTDVFGRPMSISRYGNDLYVCCKSSNNIKRVSLSDNTVSEYKCFEEGVLLYLRIVGKEIVVLNSGIYLLD